jgi:hypothetical protein
VSKKAFDIYFQTTQSSRLCKFSAQGLRRCYGHTVF